MNRALLALIFSSMTTIGCTYKTINPPLTVSTKILPELAKPDVAANAKEVLGESCNRIVLAFIPIGFATAESAYADALAKAPGTDTLISYEARTTTLFIFPFYTEVCAQVHGYAISSKQL